MISGANGYNMASDLRILGNLNRNRYIRAVLEIEIMTLLQAAPHSIFQHGNARLLVEMIMQIVLKNCGYH
jgi:hypothetical protein